MLNIHITELTDNELDAVAAGATVNFSFEAKADGLTKADIVVKLTGSATTAKTGEAATGNGSVVITTA